MSFSLWQKKHLNGLITIEMSNRSVLERLSLTVTVFTFHLLEWCVCVCVCVCDNNFFDFFLFYFLKTVQIPSEAANICKKKSYDALVKIILLALNEIFKTDYIPTLMQQLWKGGGDKMEVMNMSIFKRKGFPTVLQTVVVSWYIFRLLNVSINNRHFQELLFYTISLY